MQRLPRFDAFLADSPLAAAAADSFVQLCPDTLVVRTSLESKEVYDSGVIEVMLLRQLEGCISFVSWMNGDLEIINHHIINSTAFYTRYLVVVFTC